MRSVVAENQFEHFLTSDQHSVLGVLGVITMMMRMMVMMMMMRRRWILLVNLAIVVVRPSGPITEKTIPIAYILTSVSWF